MITLTRITESESEEYRFSEELLTTAFPRDEYRPLAEQRKNCAEKTEFHLLLARDEGTKVGFVSFWELEGICYIEHLATLPALRGKGYGKEILEQLKKTAHKIVLEVEEPVDEISTRRIGFYRRCGFRLCEIPYTQPPYRKNGNALPMLLMFHGCDVTEEFFEKIKNNIHKKIYNL